VPVSARSGRSQSPASSATLAARRPQWSPPVVGGVRARAVLVRAPSSKGPQWSPPVVGGVSRNTPRGPLWRKSPQWSPPVVGGVRQSGNAYCWRPDWPQWSPPVVGGVRGMHRSAEFSADASMESARSGRSQPVGADLVPPQFVASMESARSGRSQPAKQPRKAQ